ncbi:MAG: tetratricopeptide repeat protein [Rhizobiaceae bacterium]
MTNIRREVWQSKPDMRFTWSPTFLLPTKLVLALATMVVMTFAMTFAMSGQVQAFDPEKTFQENDEPRTILRFGFQALKKGNMEQAIGAFRFGASKNDLASQWKLARMLQSGSGIAEDDLAAYKLYSKIAARYVDKFPRRVDLPYVSNAVVALGRYNLTGIEGTRVRANPRRAEGYFYRAAALYKDRDAQYELGRLYRDGALGAKQPKTAVRWYGLSARKGHRKAQAELGEMLFYGEGVRSNPVRGLVFMTKAMANSARSGAKSIRRMQQKAFSKANAAQRQAATKIIEGLGLNTDPSSTEKPAKRSLRDLFTRGNRGGENEITVASGNDQGSESRGRNTAERGAQRGNGDAEGRDKPNK